MTTHETKSRRRGPDVRSLLYVAGVAFFVILVAGGFVRSVVVTGGIPGPEFGYLNSYRQQVRGQSENVSLPQLRIAAELDFDSVEAAVQLMVVAEKAGDAEGLELALRRLLNHSPDDALLHVRLAQVLMVTGRVEQALIHSRLAVSLDPQSDDARRIHDAVQRASEEPASSENARPGSARICIRLTAAGLRPEASQPRREACG